MVELIPTWVVAPSNGRGVLEGCISSLRNQVKGVVIVSNGTKEFKVNDKKVTIISDTGFDMNISRWWNVGIEFVENVSCSDQWNILVVNDDIVSPDNLVETLSHEMRLTTASLSFPNQHDSHKILWQRAEPVNLFHRITGFCFMLRGERYPRLDENLKWWYGDDDLDWRCRTQGGSLLVPGIAVHHVAPNGTFLEHPELHQQVSEDRNTFIEKWGKAPW